MGVYLGLIKDSDTDIIAVHGELIIGGNSLGTSASTPLYLTYR